jgi:two-component system cell cycle sensor histidine kinase/response regulator CckA
MPAMSLVSPDLVHSAVSGFSAETSPVARDTVLLVEDDQPVAALLSHILARINQRVLHARDGTQCLRLFERQSASVGLVFMDCGLPDAHGGTICRRLRALVPGLPVLLTSGREQPGLVALLAPDGPTAFLPKPYLPGDVLRHVQALLGGRVCGHR